MAVPVDSLHPSLVSLSKTALVQHMVSHLFCFSCRTTVCSHWNVTHPRIVPAAPAPALLVQLAVFGQPLAISSAAADIGQHRLVIPCSMCLMGLQALNNDSAAARDRLLPWLL